MMDISSASASCSSSGDGLLSPRPTLQFRLETNGPPEINKEEIVYGAKIGGGCFGTVYRGKCRGKDVAVKKLFRQDMNEKTLRDFKKEVEICCQVLHPNIVLFMGACTEPGEFAIVTELMPKGNMKDMLHDPKCNLSLLQRMLMARDVSHGMTWLHQSKPKIIHRDLKPCNLLVGDHSVVKLCDFGLSAVCEFGEKLQDKDTIPGTPLWMAPEVMLGKPLDEKADVYSFGIVLWEIITRQEPFPQFDSFQAFKRAICRFNTRPPVPQDIPPSLGTLLQLCWHADPASRPSFENITECLNTVIVDVAVPDEGGRSFWKQNFMGKDKVGWDVLIDRLNAWLQSSHSPTSLEYKCLRHLAATNDIDSVTSPPAQVVTLDAFGKLLGWFGPMAEAASPNLPTITFLNRIVDAVRTLVFFGNIERKVAESKLAGKPIGTYLIRLSTTKQGQFTISKVSRSGSINHQRFDYKPGYGFQIHSHHKNIHGATLGSLLPMLRDPLHLTVPCPDNPLVALLSEVKLEGYIIPSGSDSDSDY